MAKGVKEVRVAIGDKILVELEDLLEFQGDLKVLSDENYERAKTSILENDFSFCPHVWTSKGKHWLLDGHQRKRTLVRMKKEGYRVPKLPAIQVRAPNVQSAKRKVLAAASQYGQVTDKGLFDFLTENQIPASELQATYNFPDIEMPEFVDAHFRSPAQDGSDDEIPDPPKTSKIRHGDIFLLGNHRLMCGDSTSEADCDRLLGGIKADMLFTDPPYGVNYEGGHFQNKVKREKLAGDHSSEIYGRFMPLVPSLVDGPCYTWFAFTQCRPTIEAIEAIGEMHALLIWNKTNATYAAINAQYKQRHEPCIYWKPKGSTLRWSGPTDECTVWDIARDPRNDLHPTQKPVALAERAISNHEAVTVLDLFGGSGSTMIAAEKLGRHCYMMEMNPVYCDVIIARWEQFTGGKAVSPPAKKVRRPSEQLPASRT